jgi:hypothetical protein
MVRRLAAAAVDKFGQQPFAADETPRFVNHLHLPIVQKINSDGTRELKLIDQSKDQLDECFQVGRARG